MNIYRIINEYNEARQIYPWLYIGSDTKDRPHYWGSSKAVRRDIEQIGIQSFRKELLWSGTYDDLVALGYTRLTALERAYQEQADAVRSPIYYNKRFADQRFSTQGVANYWYPEHGDKKIVVLNTTDPDVLSGRAVGQHRFKTRTPSADRNRKLSDSLKRAYAEGRVPPRKGVPKSEETRARMRKPKEPPHRKRIHEALIRRGQDPAFRAKMSANNGRRTAVCQYTPSGVLIAKYPTIKDAAEAVGGGNRRCDISACCRGLQRMAHGFIWSYATQSG